MEIYAEEATISVAKVEIKTLSLSGKQITLALFRQFGEANGLDEDYEPIGKLWGRINYCPGKNACEIYDEDGNKRHDHILWEKEGMLYRFALRKSLGRECYIQDISRNDRWYEEFKNAFLKGWALIEKLPQLFIAI